MLLFVLDSITTVEDFFNVRDSGHPKIFDFWEKEEQADDCNSANSRMKIKMAL